MSDSREEFYIGYLDPAPPGVAAWLRTRLRALVVLVIAVAAALVATMSPPSTATFEYGVERSFEGTLRATPVPTLVVERPGASAGASRYLLSVFGKRGAAAEIAGLDGQYVRLRGTLVHHDERTMIELASDSIAVLDAGPSRPESEPQDLGPRTVAGEIVDSKCFLGVMKPGNLKPHRACAVRCISGGVPPVLLVRDEAGRASYYVLVGEDGSPLNQAILDRVAEPVEVTGRLERRDDLELLYTTSSAIRRLEHD